MFDFSCNMSTFPKIYYFTGNGLNGNEKYSSAHFYMFFQSPVYPGRTGVFLVYLFASKVVHHSYFCMFTEMREKWVCANL